jgi:uncharacterized membrane protein YkvA (DUF1232 family)
MNDEFTKESQTVKARIGNFVLCHKDNRTPLLAKALSFIVVAYALSPIDLIPDFIPVLGYLELIIVQI